MPLGKPRFDDPNGIIPGDITIQGDLTVTGTIAQGSETVTGDETITGDLSVAGTSTLTGDVTTSGDFIANAIGSTLHVQDGTNAKAGTVTLNGATPVSVANTSITANSVVVFSLKTVGGTVGAYPSIKTQTPTTGFTVAGTAADTSVYNYIVLEIA